MAEAPNPHHRLDPTPERSLVPEYRGSGGRGDGNLRPGEVCSDGWETRPDEWADRGAPNVVSASRMVMLAV